MNKSKIYTRVLLIFIILVVVNLISYRFFFRLDFTDDGRYTLSQATKNIVKNLDETVTVTAYMTKDLPPDVSPVRKEFKEMVLEYASLAKGNVQFEFVDPADDPKLEQKALSSGIQPVLLNMREKDEAVQKKVFLGAILQMGDQQEVIPVIQPGAAMEYALSTAIKKLSVLDKPMVGIIQGHGEPPLQNLGQVLQEMSILYSVEPVDLKSPQNDLSKYISLALIAPTDTIPAMDFSLLDQYLAQGGNLLVAINRVNANLQQGQGSSLSTGLENWLAQHGIQVENSFVIDDQCGNVGVQQQAGFFRYTTPVKFPYLPLISNFEDHPVTRGLEQVLFQFASAVEYTGDSSLTFTPLLFSSERSGSQNAPTYFNINKEWTGKDFPLSGLTLGGVLEGPIAGSADANLVVFGDGDFAVNQNPQQQINGDNVSLLVNAIDWMSDDTGLIDLRTKAVTSRPLDNIEDGRKGFLKWLNFLLPVLLILIYGIYRLQRIRMVRMRRTQKGVL